MTTMLDELINAAPGQLGQLRAHTTRPGSATSLRARSKIDPYHHPGRPGRRADAHLMSAVVGVHSHDGIDDFSELLRRSARRCRVEDSWPRPAHSPRRLSLHAGGVARPRYLSRYPRRRELSESCGT